MPLCSSTVHLSYNSPNRTPVHSSAALIRGVERFGVVCPFLDIDFGFGDSFLFGFRGLYVSCFGMNSFSFTSVDSRFVVGLSLLMASLFVEDSFGCVWIVVLYIFGLTGHLSGLVHKLAKRSSVSLLRSDIMFSIRKKKIQMLTWLTEVLGRL